MPIPTVDFPMLNWEQTNPALVGAQKGTDLITSLLGNVKSGIELKTYPQTLAQQLQKLKLDNQIKSSQAQYSQQMEQAKLAHEQQQAPYMQAQTQEAQARVPLYGAQSKQALAEAMKAKAESKYVPYTATGAYYSGLGRYNTSIYQNNPATAFARMINNPSMQSLISSNPDLAMQAAQTIGFVTQKAAGGAGQAGAVAPVIAGQIPGAPHLPNMPATGGMPAPQATQGGEQALAQGLSSQVQGGQAGTQVLHPAIQAAKDAAMDAMKPAPKPVQDIHTNTAKMIASPSVVASGQPIQFTAAQIDKMQKDTEDNLNRKSNTAQIINQRQYAGILNGLFDAGEQLMPAVSKYAGLLGKAQGSIDAVKSSLGETSDDYQSYLNFTHFVAPSTASEMRRTLGNQATDNERKIMDNVSNPLYWDSNPAAAVKQYKYLVDLYHKKVDPALASRPMETLAKLRNIGDAPAANKPPDLVTFLSVAKSHPRNKNISDKQLADYYNKKYGGG